MKIISMWFARLVLVGIFALAFLPVSVYALEVDIRADDGVSEQTVQEIKAGILKVESFYKEHYDLEINYPIKLILLSNKENYVTAIVEELGMSQEDVEKYHYNTTGITGGHTIISNLSACPGRAQRLRHIAHELTHQYQTMLTGGSYKMRWLSEGTADVMAISVLTLNGMGSLDSYAKDRTNTLRTVPRVPDLASLRNERDWIDAANTTGLSVNYYTADEAVIYLINKVGFAPIFTYFRLIGETRSGQQAFAEAFGISLADFEEEFRGHLREEGIPF